MEERQYKLLFELENKYWWHVGLRRTIVSAVCCVAKGKKSIRILDAGCGTGGNSLELGKLGFVVGVDISEHSVSYSKERGIENIVRGSVSEMPFREGVFDIVVSVDVLYHRQVPDDARVLMDFKRILVKGGTLILNLPAFECLRGPHDIEVHTKRRYERSQVCKKLLDAGFIVEKITYRNTLFAFAVFFLRKLSSRSGSEFVMLPEWINEIFLRLIYIEDFLGQFIDIPFGTSVFCVARTSPVRD